MRFKGKKDAVQLNGEIMRMCTFLHALVHLSSACTVHYLTLRQVCLRKLHEYCICVIHFHLSNHWPQGLF